MFFKQCVMAREVSGVREVHHAWIPEQFAKVGKDLKLLTGDDWEEGWKVIEVGTRQAEEYVVEHSQDYKHQRKASDI